MSWVVNIVSNIRELLQFYQNTDQGPSPFTILSRFELDLETQISVGLLGMIIYIVLLL